MPVIISANDFEQAVEIVKRAAYATNGWQEIIDYSESRIGFQLKQLDINDITVAVRDAASALKGLWQTEPYPPNLKFFYFGLFDLALPSDKSVYAGYSISGGYEWSASDPDTLCDLPYFPEGRLIRSRFLDSIKTARTSRSDVDEFIGYLMFWSAAALLSKFALRQLGISKQCVVGFDSGDFAVVFE